MQHLIRSIAVAVLIAAATATPTYAQESVRVYTLSDGMKVAGEVVIDSGSHIMIKDPVTGYSMTIERSLIVDVSNDLAAIEAQRPEQFRFDHERFPQRLKLVVTDRPDDDSAFAAWVVWSPVGGATDPSDPNPTEALCMLMAAPASLATPDDESWTIELRLGASAMSTNQQDQSSNAGVKLGSRKPLDWAEQLNATKVFGIFGDGKIRRLDLADRDARGALAFEESAKFGSGYREVSIPCGWVLEPEMAEPDLWVHALDAQYAEMEQQAASASRMIREARRVEESLAARIPVYDSRCGGDGNLSLNQRAMFTASEERECQEKLNRASASVPTSGTYIYEITIEVDCSKCDGGIKEYRPPREEYAKTARDYIALLRGAERMSSDLVEQVRLHRAKLHDTRAENYSRDAAIAELSKELENTIEWVAITIEIAEAQQRLQEIDP